MAAVAVRGERNSRNSQLTQSSDSESDEQEDSQQGQSDDVEVEKDTLYTEYFKLKGSTYHEHFQSALRRCKTLARNKTEVKLKLVIEPTNKEDENAIIVQAELENMWQPLGYIPGAKVQKAMDAITKEEIRNVKFKNIEWKYIYGLGEFRYVGYHR